MQEEPRKPSLFSAAIDVEKMMYAIDNAENIDEQIVNDFKDLRSVAGGRVDACIFRMSSLDLYIERAAKDLADAKKKLATLEKAKEHMEKYVLACVKSVTFPLKGERGEFGTKLSPGRVEFSIPVVASKSYSNIVNNLSDAEMAGIDQKFLTRAEIFYIRKDEVAKALKAGETVPFASLFKEESLTCKLHKSLLS